MHKSGLYVITFWYDKLHYNFKKYNHEHDKPLTSIFALRKNLRIAWNIQKVKNRNHKKFERKESTSKKVYNKTKIRVDTYRRKRNWVKKTETRTSIEGFGYLIWP